MEANLATQLAVVIEDEIDLAKIYVEALERAGYRTREIYDGKDALEYLARVDSPISLVLLDLNLPLVNGQEILRYIRLKKRFDSTRVILITSESAAVLGEAEAKADFVLLKPVSFSQLRTLASRLRKAL